MCNTVVGHLSLHTIRASIILICEVALLNRTHSLNAFIFLYTIYYYVLIVVPPAVKDYRRPVI